MEIQSLEIRYLATYTSYSIEQDGLHHRKALPYLSMVQALEGSYDIALGDTPFQNTGTGGVFIAPSAIMQNIVHHCSPETGRMRAQWIFMDIWVNNRYRLDALYDFPVLLPAEAAMRFGPLLRRLDRLTDLCDRLSAAYPIVKLLLAAGLPKKPEDGWKLAVQNYIDTHYAEKISAEQLAERLYVSPSTLFRRFRQTFGMSPANYVNQVRLTQAALLLETTDNSLQEIGEAVGIGDVFYLSRLFKNTYGVAPTVYRRRYRHTKDGGNAQ